MIRPSTGATRLLRAVVLAVVVVGLSATAHVAAGGGLPSAFAGLAVLVTAVSLSHLLTFRPLGLPSLVAVLGVGQLALHETFMALDSPDVLTSSAHGHGMGSAMGSAVIDAGMVTPDPGASGLMLVAHVVATLASAVLLASAERALWQLWVWLSPLVGALLRILPGTVVGRPGRVTEGPVRPRSGRWITGRSVSRRGPPPGPVAA